MNQDSSSAGLPQAGRTGSHRASRKRQSVVGRTVMVGGAAVCIGLLAEMNVPDANALSILLPGGNGNATQINIFGGKHLPARSSVSAGMGVTRATTGPSAASSSVGRIPPAESPPDRARRCQGQRQRDADQYSSYNIFNPQASILATTPAQHDHQQRLGGQRQRGDDHERSAGGLGGLFGPALGAGNTTQLSLFSSNIFNPQFSLFGDNASNNTAMTNVPA